MSPCLRTLIWVSASAAALVAAPAQALPDGAIEVTSVSRYIALEHEYYDFDENLQGWSESTSDDTVGPWDADIRRTYTGEPTELLSGYRMSQHSRADSDAIYAYGEGGSQGGVSMAFRVEFTALQTASYVLETSFVALNEVVGVYLGVPGGPGLVDHDYYGDGPGTLAWSDPVELQAGESYLLAVSALRCDGCFVSAPSAPYSVALVPEPATAALFATGLLVAAAFRRRA